MLHGYRDLVTSSNGCGVETEIPVSVSPIEPEVSVRSLIFNNWCLRTGLSLHSVIAYESQASTWLSGFSCELRNAYFKNDRLIGTKVKEDD